MLGDCCELDCEYLAVGIPGIPGIPGDPHQSTFNEVPGGVRNGVNLAFSLLNTPVTGSTRVHRNGLREYLGIGYTESGAGILFTTAPLVTDVLTVDYMIGS